MRLFQPSDIDARIMLIQQPGLKLILEQDNALARGISQDDIQKVRDATDIVALISERVPLKQRGHEFWGCCPFHHEKTPSFKVDSSSQFWHCFGCGEGGDVFGYLMKIEDISFPEAVRELADKAHIDIQEGEYSGPTQNQKKRLRDICNATADFYHNQLMRVRSKGTDEARRYLSGRKLGGDIPKKWNLGYAPGRNHLFNHLLSLGFKADEMVQANVVVSSSGKYRDRFYERVMFPINDISGECIAFGGRIMGDGQPKYLNSQETPIFHKSQVLYGIDKAKSAMASTGIAVVCEGYTDVIALHEAGIRNAVATLGTSLTRQHIRLLSRHASKKLIYLFDGDEAGQRATERALQFIDDAITPESGASRLERCALSLPDGLDPAEFIEARGAEAMNEQLEGAQPLLAFGIERRLSKHDLSSAEGRSRALVDVLDILAPIKSSILAKDYAVKIAGRLHMREQDVLDQLATLSAPKRYQSEDGREASRTSTVARSAPTGIRLSKAEQNRLRIEREFLGLAAQNPLLAIARADALENTIWHDPIHSDIAKVILEVLSTNLAAKTADLIDAASSKHRVAASILTSAAASSDLTPDQIMEYLVHELAIGDLEEKIAGLKSKLATLEDEGKSDDDGLFAELVRLQAHLNSARKSRVVS